MIEVGTNQYLSLLGKVDAGLDRVSLNTPLNTHVTYSKIPPLLFSRDVGYYLMIMQSGFMNAEHEYRDMFAWLEHRKVIKETFRPRKMQCWLFAHLTPEVMLEFKVRWL